MTLFTELLAWLILSQGLLLLLFKFEEVHVVAIYALFDFSFGLGAFLALALLLAMWLLIVALRTLTFRRVGSKSKQAGKLRGF